MNPANELILNAVPHAKLGENTRVFNKDSLEYYMWVYMLPDDVRDCYFLGAKEIGPQPKETPTHTFMHDNMCWMKIRTDFLNTRVGQHVYKLSFVNTRTDDSFSLYISYIIQDDNPEKPYIYMNREEEECNESNLR